jgi:transcriptional regulator with XRE-family HTH domain
MRDIDGCIVITREQLKAARAILGWGVRELAPKAGVTANTLSRFENGGDARGETLRRIREALEAEGIEFPDPYTIRYGTRRDGR